jgi:hypothetical protein
MDRLNFTLPDFTRLSWTSDTARSVWEPRISRVCVAFQEVEWRAVKAKVRKCAVNVLSPQELVAKGAMWAGEGLNMLPIEIQGMSPHSYSSTSLKVTAGQPFGFRVVVGTPEDVSQFKAAWDASDQEQIGRMLGYPDCCREFFRHTWVDQSMVDTTWPMGFATAKATNGTRAVEVTGPAESNILWRWMGVRAVPHLPCKFDCAATVEFGRKLIQVGRDAGFGQEMEWLLEILSWNAEWSALHGIAEIKTPILKVSTRTDATPTKYVVRRTGIGYPEEGARGLHFPYRTPAHPLLTGLSSFQKGLSVPIQPLNEVVPQWYASDNGFDSRYAMDLAHKPIVDMALKALGMDGGNMLDLGCGNGALLKKIADAAPAISVFGVDIDPIRIEHARELLPDAGSNFVAGDIFETDSLWPESRRYRLVLLMPGRIIESGADKAAETLKRLRDRCDNILVYAYGDWLKRFTDLSGLAQEAGLSCIDFEPNASVALARVK